MKMELTYKGFVCLNGDDYKLITKDGNSFKTIPINGFSNDTLDQIDKYTFKIVIFKLFDGTEQVSLDYAYDSNFDDIIISVKSIASMILDHEDDDFSEINNEIYEDLSYYWSGIEEYFSSDKGIVAFEEFIDKDVWNK